MFTSGYIKKHRTCLEWRWRKNPLIVALWDFILLSANYKEAEFESLTIQRGQFVTSLNSLSSKTGISNQSVRTSLKKLESSGELTLQTTNKFTIITVINYDSYQSREDDTNTVINKRLTNKQQTTNKRLTLIEERQEEKEEKDILDKNLEKESCRLPDGSNSELVFLTKEQKQKVKERFLKCFGKEAQNYLSYAVEILDSYITNNKKGQKYKDHYKVLIGWPLEKAQEKYKLDSNLTKIREREFLQEIKNEHN